MKAKDSNPAAHFARSAFREYGKDLHRFLLRRLRNPRDAEDLAQEVFMRLLRLDKSDLVRKPQSYVYGIASHVAYEFRMRAEHDLVTFDSDAIDRLAERPEDLRPDELIEELSTRREIEQALEQLAPTHRAVFVLNKRDGLSNEEIAAQLNLSTHTVKKYLFQAKAQLRTMKLER